MNAVVHYAHLLAPEALRRLAAVRSSRFSGPTEIGLASRFGFTVPATPRRDLDLEEALAHVAGRWSADLCGMLNVLSRAELAYLAGRLGVPTQGRSAELRARLWEHGAQLESGGLELSSALQPRPIILGGHLVVQAAPRGMYPPAAAWPRAMPPVAAPMIPEDEPETLDDLLAAADRAIGVKLGRRGADKGAWGSRAARLLGAVERGIGEPDWRGDVEIKTVPVAQEPSGLWRIVEDPAIAMLAEGTVLAKLQRTLWLARADLEAGEATIVSWYLLDWDPEIARLARRYLHTRPKGPAGTTQRGVYLHKSFFADAGLLATLNGPPSLHLRPGS
ncbi:MAG: hypothetical protein JWO36_5636 [Myxococcales bacterium]|nr:hypothetical protein [Myxococcales bacterium]